jgi:hypothetical protein
MATSTTEYRPSINIVRDADVQLNYLPTDNGQACYDKLIASQGSGRKSITIVGAYGTGKSAFLWALERQLLRKTKEQFFIHKPSTKLNYQFIRIVGDFASVRTAVGQAFGMQDAAKASSTKITEAVAANIRDTRNNGTSLVLVIDEFGKFLEYAAKQDPDGELYFLQLLAETFNDPFSNALFITTLHQDFKAYSFGLTNAQRNEWEKVKGRFFEFPFNEPVDQLLALAAARMQSLDIDYKVDSEYESLYKAIHKANAYPLLKTIDYYAAIDLLPMDILAAAVLTLSLQRFGQNQRSLFSFLESADHLGLSGYEKSAENPFFHLGMVFDYLEYNFGGLLHSKYNPESMRWSAISAALEKAENTLEQDRREAAKLIKAIGLLSIFAPNGAKIDEKFWKLYGQQALGIQRTEQVLEMLERTKIIRFVRHATRYVPFEGTDLDIESEIRRIAEDQVTVSNPLPELFAYLNFPYLIAKEYFFSMGTPRVFAFHLSEAPEAPATTDQIDGYINLIFAAPPKGNTSDGAATSLKLLPILSGYFANTDSILATIREIRSVKQLMAENTDDRVAIRELKEILASLVQALNGEVLGNLGSAQSSITWYSHGQQITIQDGRQLNRRLSIIARECYPDTPKLHNELINRSKLSSAINTARNQLLQQLIQHGDEPGLGFDPDKFPPEKTIYLSLLKETGIHRLEDGKAVLGQPSDTSWQAVWSHGIEFLNKARQSRRNLGDLVESYKASPFKLKQGLLEFWLPIFLFIQRDDYALFTEGKFIPAINEEILALIQKDPSKYELKAFKTDAELWNLFAHYRDLLQLDEQKPLGTQSLIETIKPFLVFYKQLEPYGQRTRAHLSKNTIAFRDAIANSTDPEATFFEVFPGIFGFDPTSASDDQAVLEEYIHKLKDAIRELRTAYEGLLDRIAAHLGNELLGGITGFEAMKKHLLDRYTDTHEQLLPRELKTFLASLRRPFDEQNGWLASIGFAVLGKPLDQISDQDELILYARLKSYLHELDNLSELGTATAPEELLRRVEVTIPSEGTRKTVTRIPERDRKQVETLKEALKKKLAKSDDEIAKAALIALLEDYLKQDPKA